MQLKEEFTQMVILSSPIANKARWSGGALYLRVILAIMSKEMHLY